MPGKLCTGTPRANAGAGTLRNSKAYCEGMQYRSEGTEVGKPDTDNPHSDGSEAATAWYAGWDFANFAAGGAIDTSETCCQVTGTILV